MTDKTKIIIADLHRMVREAFAVAFGTEQNIEVMTLAETGRKAVELSREHCPDIVIMSNEMPDMNGIEASRHIRSQNPDARIIALAGSVDRQIVMGMLNAGVSGFLLKSCAFEELIKAIDTVVCGQTYLCPKITGMVVETALSREPEEESAMSALSQREREVLQLIAEGHKNKDIADKLFISIKTVKIHRASLKKKLNLQTTACLTRFAVSNNITSLEFINPVPPPDQLSH